METKTSEDIEKYDFDDWKVPYELLRRKWSTIPCGPKIGRKHVQQLLNMKENEIVEMWKSVRDDVVRDHRSWFHELYKEFMKNKRMLDVGCGFGMSSISFAQMGANVTYVDIIKENVKLVEKICHQLGLGDSSHFLFLKDNDDLKKLSNDFDVITAIGSLHNAPFDIMKQEVAELVRHLKIGGRWLQFAYPKSRWLREGSMPFKQWGEKTDGSGTPWCEWYDVDKLLSLLSPAKFEDIFYYEWHNNDFNWFDLKLVDKY